MKMMIQHRTDMEVSVKGLPVEVRGKDSTYGPQFLTALNIARTTLTVKRYLILY